MKNIFAVITLLFVGFMAFAEPDVIDAKYAYEHNIFFMADNDELPSEYDSECPENNYHYSVMVAKNGTHIIRMYVTNDLEKATNFYERGFWFTLYNNDNRGKLLQKICQSDEKPYTVYFVYEMK